MCLEAVSEGGESYHYGLPLCCILRSFVLVLADWVSDILPMVSWPLHTWDGWWVIYECWYYSNPETAPLKNVGTLTSSSTSNYQDPRWMLKCLCPCDPWKYFLRYLAEVPGVPLLLIFSYIMDWILWYTRGTGALGGTDEKWLRKNLIWQVYEYRANIIQDFESGLEGKITPKML